MCQQIWKAQQWPQDWKRSVFIPIPKKGNAKECSNYCTFAFISQARKASSKFSKLGFNSTCIVNIQMFKLVLEKAEDQRSNCQHPLDHGKRKRVTEKTSISALLTMTNPLTVWIIANCGKFFKRGEYQTT